METTLLEPKSDMQESRKCPFCAEQIQVEAIKCRFCGEFLDNRRPAGPSKWYFSKSVLVLAVLCMGPLALPLAWVNPRYRVTTKLLITILVIGLTLGLSYLMLDTYRRVTEQIQALGLG